MRYREKKTTNGALYLDIDVDSREEKIYCVVILAIYGTYEKNGDYKTYYFSTLKAANKKFDTLIDRI
jgi:hypothetical protein